PLRQLLDLYACIRPVRYFEGVPSPMREPQRLDVVIFRENIEDVYSGVEYRAGSGEADAVIAFLMERFGAKIRPGSAIGIKPMSKFGSQRLVVKAIQYALRAGRRSVTLVHKGNIKKFTEGGFREWGYEIAKEKFAERTVPESEAGGGKGDGGRVIMKDRITDAMFAQLVLRPDEYSVIAAPNLNGDLLSDAAAAQVGGLGLAPGGNVGDGYAVFEATHGTAPKYAGLDKVNPGSVILSGAMMFAELDRAAAGIVGRAIASGDFKGKRDETALLYPSGAKPQRVLLVGLGKPGDVTRNSIRRAAAVAAKRARALGTTQFAFALAAEARNGVAAADVGQVVVEGAAQGAWAFTELKAAPDDPKPEVETVAIACDAKEAKALSAGERLGEATAAGHFLTRYLQMLPGNVCTPGYLADRAKQLADQHGFTCTVLDRAQMRQENMGALLAVAQGSQQDPRFIVLEYRGAGADAPVALVGKGVTFDSGGISIK